MAQAARRVEDDRPAYSGRLLLRMPPELHADVARRAEREHLSLNQYIVRALAGSVGRPLEQTGPARNAPREAPRRTVASPRAIGMALLLNLIVVTIAAAAAIALLVLAWTRL